MIRLKDTREHTSNISFAQKNLERTTPAREEIAKTKD